MGELTPRLALLRLSGEIGIKARATRMQFRKRLVQNLRDALESSGLPANLEISHDRLYASLPAHTPLEDHALARVFGVSSLSLVERHEITALPDIVRMGASLFADEVRGRHFAVRARRVGRREGTTASASEVERRLGAALLPHAAGVDLEHPEVTVRLELTEHDTSFFTGRAQGPGGLPLGVEGRAVALLSGGFDSAVATWQIQKRGVECDLVFCNLGGAAHLLEVLRVAVHLATRWSYGAHPRLFAIDFEPVAHALRACTTRRYWQILLKRQMLRAAEAVAEETGASAIVTGDSVGQVSSQTLPNLAVVSRATPLPLLRPLVGFDKSEIVDRARAIGTYELSESVGEYCALVPNKPATQARLDAVLAEEARLPDDPLRDALAARTSFDLRALAPSAFDDADLAVDALPADAVLLDLRPIAQYRGAHHPAALHLDFASALAAWPGFDRTRRYVLVCEYGLLSAQLADHMRRDGFRVHHFRGGQRALIQADGR
ncbi:MAG TPA: tRNA uracil 4-sulfurtransferase ThiI [Myxococcota bacterium]|nr:tRNA uracil 4-sulfurtransferase ThiI [Myxococcota bacterium]